MGAAPKRGTLLLQCNGHNTNYKSYKYFGDKIGQRLVITSIASNDSLRRVVDTTSTHMKAAAQEWCARHAKESIVNVRSKKWRHRGYGLRGRIFFVRASAWPSLRCQVQHSSFLCITAVLEIGHCSSIHPAVRPNHAGGTPVTPRGCCCVMQCIFPPPKATSRVLTCTTSRPGNNRCAGETGGEGDGEHEQRKEICEDDDKTHVGH